VIVQHMVGDEHHETVEIHRGDHHPLADAARTSGARWVAGDAHFGHDHGCATSSVLPHEPPPLVLLRAVTRLSWKTVDPLALAEAPRGPPLDFAPKTSPPAA
jgi:hypothetical protein